MEKIDGHGQENQSSKRQFHVWDSSGHLHLHAAASPCCLPSFRFNAYRPVHCGGSRRGGSLRLLMHSGLQHLDLRDAVSLLVDLLHPRTFLPVDLLQLPD